MGKTTVKRICVTGMLIAVYVILKYISANIGVDIKINIALLPILFSAIMIGIPEAVAVGILGEFVIQMMTYGLTITTPLWVLPPAIHGLFVGIFAYFCRKKGKPLFQRPVLMFAVVLSSCVLVTAANTGVMIVDSILFRYPYEFLAITTVWRFLIGLGSGVVSCLILLPLCRALYKTHLDVIAR